ncbi:EKC/KEOPS complex subunit LAGE3-like [Bos indicus x Bos taurus]|uniref:L antigen family member 3 n=1 Tax=Bos indicus x Bos taurus TaxID=30522 RepID=A0A4W2FUB2_BOBOX|nr:EKC/KEOPS complex subunit LAGE3-like [Bos taurus]XP_027390818.1 EKC/KEOPS complex subunit LAGE3-like [Bos indicus x Bos taurus]
MQASGSGAGGAEGEGPGRSGYRAPLRRRGGPGRERALMEAARARPRGERAPDAPGPGGDVAPVAVRPRRGEVVLTLRVPFQSPLEVYLARRSLLPDIQRHQGIIRKEFLVNGSDLIVRWTADDLAFIRLSINPFLDQLFVVIDNIRSLATPPPQSLG